MRSSIATLAVVGVFALSACSGDDKKADYEDSRPATANAATSTGSASSTAARASSGGTSGAASSAFSSSSEPVSAPASTPAAAAGGGSNRTNAEATCDLLRRNTPKWKALGKEGTMAQLSIEYYNFVLDTSKPGDLPPDAAELDAITTKSCPEVRSELLKIMEVDKFLGTL